MYKHFEDNAESQQLSEAQSNKIAKLKKGITCSVTPNSSPMSPQQRIKEFLEGKSCYQTPQKVYNVPEATLVMQDRVNKQ